MMNASSDNYEKDMHKVIYLLRNYEVDLNPELNSSYKLKLNIESNKEGVEKFLQKASKLRLPNIREIWISPINFLSDSGIDALNKFFTNSTPNHLRILHLKTISDGFDKISSSLPNILC